MLNFDICSPGVIPLTAVKCDKSHSTFHNTLFQSTSREDYDVNVYNILTASFPIATFSRLELVNIV